MAAGLWQWRFIVGDYLANGKCWETEIDFFAKHCIRKPRDAIMGHGIPPVGQSRGFFVMTDSDDRPDWLPAPVETGLPRESPRQRLVAFSARLPSLVLIAIGFGAGMLGAASLFVPQAGIGSRPAYGRRSGYLLSPAWGSD